jgi:hypothetical protein
MAAGNTPSMPLQQVQVRHGNREGKVSGGELQGHAPQARVLRMYFLLHFYQHQI